MSDCYVGEIRMFAGNFAPAGWAFCEGQMMPISENETLFNLIGTTYGGDGQETFALPDLRGRVPLHSGTHPPSGRTLTQGEQGGVETVTLTTSQMPNHTHLITASSDRGTAAFTNTTGYPAATAVAGTAIYGASNGGVVAMAANAVSLAGGSQPHDNMAPYLCVSFIISLYGVFPSQT